MLSNIYDYLTTYDTMLSYTDCVSLLMRDPDATTNVGSDAATHAMFHFL